jgi:hypothetical protein
VEGYDMTKDEIIEMAIQAKILEKGDEWVFDMSNAFELTTNQNQLKTFAKLVAEKEREAILGLADSLGWVSVDHIQSRGQA